MQCVTLFVAACGVGETVKEAATKARMFGDGGIDDLD